MFHVIRCICNNVCVCVSVCMCTYMYLCVRVCGVYACARAYVHGVCACVCLCLYLSLPACLLVCMYICMHVCVCVHASIMRAVSTKISAAQNLHDSFNLVKLYVFMFFASAVLKLFKKWLGQKIRRERYCIL